MIYLELEHVSKSYGEKVLFDRISLPINKGNKVALVAKNGTGKSTLLRIAAGMDLPEGVGAKVYKHKEARLHYLDQSPDFGEDQTVLDAIFDSDNPMTQAILEYERALLLPDQQERLQPALNKMDRLNAWDFEAKIKETLTRLNIDELNMKVSQLSGGQRKRLALARMIIAEPDMLILDEPTNHLDIDMIEWLEEYLSQPNLTILMVTHDRYFLERVCDEIVELDQGQLFRYSGNYSDFLLKKSTRHEIESSEHDKNTKILRRELEWLNRQPKARGTKGKARVDSVLDLKDKVNSFKQEQELQIDIKGQRLGKKILEAHNIGKTYGDKILVAGFDYKFMKGERVGIVGPNGVGKSTFLHMLTQEIRPDTGKVVVGGNTVFGYYTQDGINLKEDQRVIDVVRDIAEFIPLEKGQKLTAEQLLERFLFPRPQQQVYVSQLSGGERRRLYLLTVLMRNPNFLILDEPTNDLDIITLNVLEEFLMEFPGCILVVSHDRYFLDKLVDHLFIFEGEGKIRDFIGDYSDYRVEQRERERAQRRQERAVQQERKAVADQRQGGLSQEQKKEVKRLEKKIERLEAQKAEISAQFHDTSLSPERITELSKELGAINEEIEELEMRWLELAEQA
ncbi:MAG: ABC-F family ATP-binding cassette domain-containing protein [Lewinella sp.]|nr:ABC-F family ATP-binding cassette domain-containing protein [Lewinella sp.]